MFAITNSEHTNSGPDSLHVPRAHRPCGGANCRKRHERQVMEVFECHPHFRGRTRWVNAKICDRKLYLDGQVPNFYLKQLAQEVVRTVPGFDQIVNRIVVISPTGKTRGATTQTEAEYSKRAIAT